MREIFYITPRPEYFKQSKAKLLTEGKCYPVIEVFTSEVGGNLKFLVAGDDGNFTYPRPNEVLYVGTEIKDDADIDTLIYKAKPIPPTKSKNK